MNVEIVYHGSVTDLSNVYFRVFPNGDIINGNMYLWLDNGSVALMPDVAQNVTINPQYPHYSINPAISSMVVAYYGAIQRSYYLK